MTDYTDFVAEVSSYFEDVVDDDVIDEIGGDEPTPDYPEYDKDQFLSEAYMSEEQYDNARRRASLEEEHHPAGCPPA